MSRMKFKKHVLEFYNEFLVNTSINSSESVAWSSHNSQYKRFEVLYDIGVQDTDTILDLGCGLGHLVDFLRTKNYPIKNYSGIDINPNYIAYAIQRNEDAYFNLGEIFDVTNKHDYVIGSGVFTVLMSLDEIFEAMDAAYKICNKGMAFNFLTKDYLEIKGFNSFEPSEFYSIIAKRYQKTKLVEGYLENEDFTIYIYK